MLAETLSTLIDVGKSSRRYKFLDPNSHRYMFPAAAIMVTLVSAALNSGAAIRISSVRRGPWGFARGSSPPLLSAGAQLFVEFQDLIGGTGPAETGGLPAALADHFLA
jgi:hypothetical protein